MGGAEGGGCYGGGGGMIPCVLSRLLVPSVIASLAGETFLCGRSVADIYFIPMASFEQ